MKFRAPVPSEAAAICTVLRRSITELCTDDHHDDPAVLGQWLANKTPENIAIWLESPDYHYLVAAEKDEILGVGCVSNTGEIMLNYVSPDARFRGVSRAMVEQLEHIAKNLGNEVCVLESTGTARRLYLSIGYVQNGEPGSKYGPVDYPMIKYLSL